MKRALIVLLICAGCGSTSAGTTHTVTVTKTAPSVTDHTQLSACQSTIRSLLQAGKELLKGTQAYSSQVQPAYQAGLVHGSVTDIVNKFKAGTAHVTKGTAILNRAQAMATVCAG